MSTKEIEISVTKIISETLNVSRIDVTPEATFKDLGADSLDSVEVIMALEKEFDVRIDDSEAEKVLTVGDAIVSVIKNLENKENETKK